MIAQTFFIIEYNLEPLQKIIRSYNCSAFLTYDDELGFELKQNAEDSEIIKKVAKQKKELGIDRIILVRDGRDFTTHLGTYEVKKSELSPD